MKFCSAFVVAALICSFGCIQPSSGGPITDFVKNAIAGGLNRRQAVLDFAKGIFNKYVDQGTELSDMSPELLDAFLDNLDLPDLVTMARVNRKFRLLATDLFRRKYSNITINENFLRKKSLTASLLRYSAIKLGYIENEEFETHRVLRNHVLMFDYELIVDTITYLGGGIMKVTLSNRPGFGYTKEMERINELVNRYCHYTLVELMLENANTEMLNAMTRPFTKIEHVSFAQHTSTYVKGRVVVPLNETFPALRRLSLELFQFDSDFFVCHFPHLSEISVDTYYDEMFSFGFIGLLMQQNPQVHVFNAGGYPELLALATKFLPNIRNLKLWNVNLRKDIIHFDSVTTFTTKDVLSSPHNLEFSQLNELQFSCNGANETVNSWIDFLDKHKHITNFSMEYSDVTDEQFDRISAHLPAVEEMSLNHSAGQAISAHSIITFLQNNQQLKKFQSIKCTPDDYETINMYLLPQWSVQYHDDCLFLERK